MNKWWYAPAVLVIGIVGAIGTIAARVEARLRKLLDTL